MVVLSIKAQPEGAAEGEILGLIEGETETEGERDGLREGLIEGEIETLGEMDGLKDTEVDIEGETETEGELMGSWAIRFLTRCSLVSRPSLPAHPNNVPPRVRCESVYDRYSVLLM